MFGFVSLSALFFDHLIQVELLLLRKLLSFSRGECLTFDLQLSVSVAISFP